VSKIVIGESIVDGKPGRDVKLDVDLLIPSRLLIQANSGGGKSFLLRRLMEALWKIKVQTIVIDPEGEFYTLREKFGYVLVGENGETPADVRSAALLAEKFLQLKASAVCDLYEAFRSKPMQQRQWVRAFLNALLDAPRALWHPLVVVVDEAHKFCPQESPKAASMTDREIIGGCKDAMIALSTTGRKRGFCPIWATQRLAKLDKDASAEFFNRMVGMTIEDVDVDRAADLMSVSKADRPAFRASLRQLTPGEFYCFGRAITTERELVMVGPVETHHPETGKAAKNAVAPPMPEEVKGLLPQLSDLPKQAEDKARTEAEYKREVADLRRKLAAAEKKQPAPAPPAKSAPDPRAIERAVATAIKQRDSAWTVAVRAFQKELERRVAEGAKVLSGQVHATPLAPPAGLEASQLVASVRPEVPTPAPRPEPMRVAARPPREQRQPPAPGEAPPLGSTAIQIAGILAAYYPQQMKRSILAALCGKTDGGTFGNRLSEVRVNGLLDDPAPGFVRATELCSLEYAGAFNPPTDTAEMLALWKPKLGQVCREILDYLVQLNGQAIHRGELAQALGYTDGGTFGNRLSELRVAGLIVDPGKALIAANKEALFLNGEAA
jgi:hypothetical protein